jgi:hypothetical protein
LFLIIQGLSTGGADPNYKINPNGTSITSTAGSISTGDSGTATGSGSQLYLNFNESEGTNSNNAWALNIYNYANTTNYKPFSLSGYSLDDDAAHMATNIGGAIRTNSAITSLDFVTLAGSFSTGTVLVYGVN